MNIRVIFYLSICLSAGAIHASPGTAESQAVEAAKKQLVLRKSTAPSASTPAADANSAKTAVENLAAKLIKPAHQQTGGRP